TPATSATTTPATSATTTPATSATTTSATSATTTSATSATTTPASTKYAPIYDSRLEFIFGDDLNNRRRLSATILGNFSSYGNRINVNGDVVK
uniref:Uncharacterized protein n=1 Tax=Romanomermis culicivorax TaxID=13658 RepID=A0A915INI1_ROMCU